MPISVSLGAPPYAAKVTGAVLRPMCGYGAQLFTELFRTGAPTPQHLTSRLTPLGLGHCRVAVQAEAVKPGPLHDELMATIGLADKAGANVNLTWWHGPYFKNPKQPSDEGFIGKELMRGFADVIEEARRRFTSVTHLTIQNEPNAHDLGREGKAAASMRRYNQLYRFLHDELGTRNDPRKPGKKLRPAFQLVGGDLVAGGPAGIPGSEQADWIKFMQQNMADVLNGYSIHVYWASGDFDKFEQRLTHLLDFKIQKPVFVTEYGVRGSDFPQKNRIFEQGSLHGKNVEDSKESAFQHAWFNALAPQHGVVGLSKWACYRIDTGNTTPAGNRRPERDSGMICGSGRDFAATHNYRVALLFNRLVGPGWKAASMGTAGDVLVSTFAGGAGQQSLVTLNRSGQPKDVRIGRVLASRSYQVAAWNHRDDGQLTPLPAVRSDSQGFVNLPTVGPSEVVALSTRPFKLNG